MTKKAYPLEQLATIKQRKLEEAERLLEEKKQLLLKEEKKLRAVEKERDEVKEHRFAKLTQLRETLDEGSTTDKIQQMKAYLKVVDEQLKQKEVKVKEQQKQVKAAEEQVEIARQNLFEKQRDVEKLEIHRKEWKKEVLVEEAKEEAHENDELGSGIYSRKKKKKS
jgi:flagellar biosynthesis chaperone FliJ